MKILVVGGTSGAGKEIADYLDADRIGRKDNLSLAEIIIKAKSYDVVINCISDNYQFDVMKGLVDHNKENYNITFGGLKGRLRPGHTKHKIHELSESIVFNKNYQKHTLVNPAWLWTTCDENPNLEPIQPKDMLTTIKFLLDYYQEFNSVITQIDIKGGKNVN